MYVGQAGEVLRYPYRKGDTEASGEPQTLVSDLAIGGSHRTRDLAFSPNGQVMYVAVRSGSNVAECK